MSLSWNEIRARASEFSLEWKDERSEDAEAKTFWDDFFKVFGTKRRRLAYFEQAVKKLDGRTGFIDLFWPGTLLVEHKSRGKSLERALITYCYTYKYEFSQVTTAPGEHVKFGLVCTSPSTYPPQSGSGGSANGFASWAC